MPGPLLGVTMTAHPFQVFSVAAFTMSESALLQITSSLALALLAFPPLTGWRRMGGVIVLERETQPLPPTGRSAAQFMESYGSLQVRRLTRASRASSAAAACRFCAARADAPARQPVRAATIGQEDLLREQWELLRQTSPNLQRLDAAHACALFPVLQPDKCGALLDPDTCDMDVDALLQGFLRGVRQAGGQIVTQAEVKQMRREKDRLYAVSGSHIYRASGGECCGRFGRTKLPGWPVPSRSDWSPGAGLHSRFQCLKAWDTAAWPIILALRKTGTSSLMPDSCWALPPTRSGSRRTMCVKRNRHCHRHLLH